MQKGSVDLKAIVWLRNSIVLIALGSYHGSIDLQLMLCASMQSPRRLHIASIAFSCCRYRSLFAGTFSLIYKYRSRPVNKQLTVPFSLYRTSLYSLSKPSRDCTRVLKRFYALFLPMCTLSRCLVHAMPPQSTKIEHLPRDASAILRERYLVGTFSGVT